MESPVSNPVIENDVLHIESQTRLTPEEIAKAVAHHNRHHHENQAQASAQPHAQPKKRK